MIVRLVQNCIIRLISLLNGRSLHETERKAKEFIGDREQEGVPSADKRKVDIKVGY